MVTQFAIEPHAYMAAPDGDGVVVWSAIQHPNWLQRVIASLLELPLAKVRILARIPAAGSVASSMRSTSRCSRSWRFVPVARSASS
jgi:CO/xanthine dehydrogenase Mo-binding subunit